LRASSSSTLGAMMTAASTFSNKALVERQRSEFALGLLRPKIISIVASVWWWCMVWQASGDKVGMPEQARQMIVKPMW